MQAGGGNRLGHPLRQALEMAFGGVHFLLAQQRFLLEQFPRHLHVAGHEDVLRQRHVVHDAGVQPCDLRETLPGKIVLIADFFDAMSIRFLSMMSPICSRLVEKVRLHVAPALGLVEVLRREPGEVVLDRFIKAVND